MSGDTLNKFACLRELRAAAAGPIGCPFCLLVCDAMGRYSRRRVDDEVDELDKETLCSLGGEVDGRQVGPDGEGAVNRTQRVRLSWPEKMSDGTKEAYLVFVAPGG